jgi:hypothetical protein
MLDADSERRIIDVTSGHLRTTAFCVMLVRKFSENLSAATKPATGFM